MGCSFTSLPYLTSRPPRWQWTPIEGSLSLILQIVVFMSFHWTQVITISSAMKSERCTVIPGCLYYTFFSVNLPWDILWIGTNLNRSFPRCFQVLIKTNKRISSEKIGKPLSRPIRVKQSPFVTCLCVFFPALSAGCVYLAHLAVFWLARVDDLTLQHRVTYCSLFFLQVNRSSLVHLAMVTESWIILVT